MDFGARDGKGKGDRVAGWEEPTNLARAGERGGGVPHACKDYEREQREMSGLDSAGVCSGGRRRRGRRKAAAQSLQVGPAGRSDSLRRARRPDDNEGR